MNQGTLVKVGKEIVDIVLSDHASQFSYLVSSDGGKVYEV